MSYSDHFSARGQTPQGAPLPGREAEMKVNNAGGVVVVDQTEMHDDLVQDMVDILTSFCARLYGRRAAKNRAAKALAAAEAPAEDDA